MAGYAFYVDVGQRVIVVVILSLQHHALNSQLRHLWYDNSFLYPTAIDFELYGCCGIDTYLTNLRRGVGRRRPACFSESVVGSITKVGCEIIGLRMLGQARTSIRQC